MTDILEHWSILRCAYPVRGFDFSPSRSYHSSHTTNTYNNNNTYNTYNKRHSTSEPDIALVSLVRNILEIYQVPTVNSLTSTSSASERTPVKLSLVDLHGHRSDVRAVAVSTDGRLVATCSSDGLRVSI